jgi:hypothetical protein
MVSSGLRLPINVRYILAVIVLTALLVCAPSARAAEFAYIRVNQAGYEANGSRRVYLMSTAAETGATFQVINLKRAQVFSGISASG